MTILPSRAFLPRAAMYSADEKALKPPRSRRAGRSIVATKSPPTEF